MAEMILQSRLLPEALFRLIPTEKIKVQESNGEIRLIPIKDSAKPDSVLPILGMYTDGKLTVEMHHAWSREDKEKER